MPQIHALFGELAHYGSEPFVEVERNDKNQVFILVHKLIFVWVKEKGCL